MAEPADQEFLRSVFLMEAWDTVAAIEEGIAALAVDGPPPDDLLLVTHRLKGTASLYGFVTIAGVTEAMEDLLSSLPTASSEAHEGARAHLQTLAGQLKTALEAIGACSAAAERREPVAADPVREEIATFFQNSDVVEYFRPEAAEHLDAMAQALAELGRE